MPRETNASRRERAIEVCERLNRRYGPVASRIGWRSHPRHMRRSLSKPSKICSRFCRMSIGNRSITSGYRLAARFALPVLPNARSARWQIFAPPVTDLCG